jgi:hypothetical protein
MRKKRLAIVFTCLFSFLMISLISGCEKKQPAGRQAAKSSASSQPKVTEQESQTQTGIPDIERVDIPLDSSLPDAAASTVMNAYFIFDGSGSMNDNVRGSGFDSKLEGAKWAVEEFLKHVPADINLGLLVFDSHGTREVVPLGPNNHERFLQAVRQIRGGGGTPLAESIRTGTDKLIEQYKKQLGYGEYRLVVVTDGIASGIPKASQYAMRYGFPIYTIGLYVEEEHPLRAYSISYKAADSFEDLQKGLTASLAETEYFDPTEFEEQ